MKYFLILFMLAAFPIFSQQNTNMEKVQNIINQVNQKYAPDKRTAVFNVSVKSDGEKNILSGETNIKEAKEDLLNLLNKEGEKIVDEINLLPDSQLGNDIYGIIDISVATLRTEPKEAAELSTQALLGCTIKLLKKSRGWFLVQTPDNYVAWLESGSFEPVNEARLKDWHSTKRIIFTKENGFSYSERNGDSVPVSDLVAGDILKELGRAGDFVQVEYPDKRSGYVKINDCEDFEMWLNSRDLTADNIINTAKRFMGTPYLWGGTSAKTMDCSGFTRTVFFLNGVYLPRDASQQVFVGVPVDTHDGFNNLKPGDLLFFGKKATANSKEKITHVGIYIGNYEFIHEAGQVHISSFDKSKKNFSKYRLNQFVRAKRIITSVGKNGVLPLKDVNY